MALSQIVKELILGIMGGEPSRADEVISGLEGGQNAVQADGSVPFTAPQAGIAPVVNADLATKAYVDAHSGSPAGSNTQVQFNDSSSFGGDSGLVYNKTTNTLTTSILQLDEIKDTDSQPFINAGTKQITTAASVVLADFSGTNPSFNSKLLTNILDPVSAQDAATKNYVDTSAGYTPAVSSDWNDDAPTTIKAALDRIAAALGPIA